MKNSFSTLLVTVSLAFSALTLDAASAEALLNAYVEAIGGVEDYREVDGVKIPFTMKIDAGQAGSFSLRVKEVRHGVALDDKLFTMPAQ